MVLGMPSYAPVPSGTGLTRAAEVLNAGERVDLLIGQGARGARTEVPSSDALDQHHDQNLVAAAAQQSVTAASDRAPEADYGQGRSGEESAYHVSHRPQWEHVVP